MRVGASYPQSSSEITASNVNTEAAKGQGAAAAESSSGAESVKVTLSAKARELDEARSPESSEKVERLRAAVQSGQLPIDPQKIAAAIIGE
jgi:flagellar biosynthesis anti-sigma factor FlgM